MGRVHINQVVRDHTTFWCCGCKKELPPGVTIYRPSTVFRAYCSMACARKALGIEPTYTDCQKWVAANMSSAVCMMCCNKPACANYEPEAEPEVPELYWDTPQKRGKNIRQALRTLDNAVLVHDAYWPVDAQYAQLFLEAPQTAANLAKAEAENVELRTHIDALQNEVDLFTNGPLRAENDKLRAEIDANEDKAQATFEALKAVEAESMATHGECADLCSDKRRLGNELLRLREALDFARWRAGRARWYYKRGEKGIADKHLQSSHEEIDAALGQDGAK